MSSKWCQRSYASFRNDQWRNTRNDKKKTPVTENEKCLSNCLSMRILMSSWWEDEEEKKMKRKRRRLWRRKKEKKIIHLSSSLPLDNAQSFFTTSSHSQLRFGCFVIVSLFTFIMGFGAQMRQRWLWHRRNCSLRRRRMKHSWRQSRPEKIDFVSCDV